LKKYLSIFIIGLESSLIFITGYFLFRIIQKEGLPRLYSFKMRNKEDN